MKILADTFKLTHQTSRDGACRSYRLAQGSGNLLHVEICHDAVDSIWGFPHKIDKARLSVDDEHTEQVLLIAKLVLVKLQLSSLRLVALTGQDTESWKLSYKRAEHEHDVNGLDTRLALLVALLQSSESQRTETIGLHCKHCKLGSTDETSR